MSDDLETPQDEEIKGLDAAISKGLEGYDGDSAPAASTAPEDAAPDEGQPDLKIDATGRAHGADGKFVPKNPAEAETPQDGPAKAEATPATDTPEPALVQPVQAPQKWSEAEKAEFAKLPRPIQEWLVKRDGDTEADYTRKSQEIAEQRKSIEPLIGEVQQLNPLFQRFGMTPQQFMRESAIVADRLTSGTPENQGEAIAYLARLHNIPAGAILAALGIPISQAGDGAVVNPADQQLHHQVTMLTRELQQIKEHNSLLERQRAEADFVAIGQTKDEQGQLRYPHFERVKQTMLHLVASGQAETWDTAYAKSVRLDDDLYKQTVEAERQKAADEAEKARLAAVEKAKKAQPVKSSSSPPKGDSVRNGLEAHLSAAIERSGIGA